MKLSQHVKLARKKLRLTYRGAAQLSGGAISKSYIQYVESGFVTTLSPDKLVVLCKVFKLDYLKMMIVAGHIRKQDLK